jgi:hypothetical protein
MTQRHWSRKQFYKSLSYLKSNYYFQSTRNQFLFDRQGVILYPAPEPEVLFPVCTKI